MSTLRELGDILCKEIVPDLNPDNNRRFVAMAGISGKLGPVHESFTVLYGDKVDQADPYVAEHVKRAIRDNEIMREYITNDRQRTDHLRMLWEVKQKPINRLPHITLMTINVRAALGAWA